MCGLRPTISSRFQPGEILQTLCGEGSPKTEKCQQPEKEAPMRTIRSENTLIFYWCFKRLSPGGWDKSPLYPQSAFLTVRSD